MAASGTVTVTPVKKERVVTDSYLVVEAGNQGQSYTFGRYENHEYTTEQHTADTEYSVMATVKVRHGSKPSTWERAFILVYGVNTKHATHLAYDVMTEKFGKDGWTSYGRTVRTADLPAPLK